MKTAIPLSASPRSPRRARRFRRFAAACAFLAAALFAGAAAHATGVPIPNGDFSDPANDGTIGGGLIGGTGTDVPIGSGPWLGSYHGVLGLLAPPQLQIADGEAVVGGLAGVSLLGILNNGGYFSQTLPVPYTPGQRYTLSTHVDTGTVLNLGLLSSSNFGLAFRSSDGTTLLSTATAPPELVTLAALGGTEYLLTLAYDAVGPVGGDIDVQLLGTPGGLLGVNLLNAVAYSHVALDATAIDPLTGTVVGVEGTQQTAAVGTAFPQSLSVQVLDGNGDPSPGVEVDFALPDAGASAALSATSAQTDANGVATVTATANTVAGSYTVTGSVAGVSSVATFALTNTAGPAASVTAIGDGAAQSTPVSTPFPDPLLVTVADPYGNPVPDVDVTFVPPTSGASAALSATTVATDASGLAQVDATANDVAGSYAVVAHVDGVATTANFALTNTPAQPVVIDEGGGAYQEADIGSAFACALQVSVTNADGSPQVGVDVQFDAPTSGPSATLFDGSASGPSLLVPTDANGTAKVQVTANDVPGAYTVSATLAGSSADPVLFPLANVESLLFANGFDSGCPAFP